MIMDMCIFGLIYILYFYPKWKEKELIYHTFFYVYMMALFALTLSPFFTSLTSVFSHPFQPMMMEPFRDVVHGYKMADLQVFLNVLLFIPFGFLVPHIFKLKGKSVVVYSFLLSTFIEMIQPMINSYRSSDITDVICNTLGGLVGYLLYKLALKLKK